MKELKSKAEAILFSSGRKMPLEEIAKLCRSNPEEVESALTQLAKDYDEDESSLMVVNEGKDWKLTVREKHIPLVRKITPETELSKTLMETLAVVAWKAPTLQSDVIKLRTNKAYDHLDQLESMVFITRQKKGRTKLIKLTEKFYKYFDLENDEQVHKAFKKFKDKAYEENKERQLMKIDTNLPATVLKNQDK